MPSPLDNLDDVKREGLVKAWLNRIDDALKREKNFRNFGRQAVNIYEAKKPDTTPFAILYSNTEVLQPSLYNARPIPIVTRRFKDADPVGKAAAETSTRLLKFLIDTESKDYDNFDELVQAANLDALLVNRGITRFKYVAHESVAYSECVYGEAVRWDKFFHGYARTWKKVPWIGFEWDMTLDEIRENFPDITTIDIRNMAVVGGDGDDDNKSDDSDELKGVKLYKVYEIWDKNTKKVMFFSGVSRKSPLRMVDDPLGLSGFFPVPRPLNFMKKVTTLIPTPLYEQYKSQASELNELTRRLKAIIKAIKFRGFYNAAIEDIERLMELEDNKLIPAQNMQALPDGMQNVDSMIWTVPVHELVQVAQSLYQEREQCKSVIYEITGISDILRGASVASETATAQNIKNQWGTLRLKKMQKEVQRYCREALSIILEIATTKFEPQTIQQMTGLPFLFDGQKQEISAQLQAAQMRAQTMAAMQPSPQPGQPPAQPPQPPQLPPELAQLMQEPSWNQIISLLQNDVARAYKTDIETNSTIDAEAAQDKQDIAELLNALSQFLNGIAPLVEQGVMPIGVAKEILLVITRRYNFGSNLEDMLSQMGQQQQQQGPKPEEQAAAAEAQAKLGQIQAESAAATQEAQQKMALSQQEFTNKRELMALEMQRDKQKLMIEQQELAIKERELEMQMAGVNMKRTQQKEAHEQKMTQLRAKNSESSDASI